MQSFADRTIPPFLERRVSIDGHRLFVTDGEQYLSYSDFFRLVMRATGGLRDIGVRSGNHVALVLGTTIPHLVLWQAVVRIGAVVASVNPHLLDAELASALKAVEADFVVGDETRELEGLQCTHMFASSELLAGAPDDVQANVHSTDVASLILTSGTTAIPKVVMQTHQTYVLTGEAFPWWTGLEPEDRLLVVLPMHHINAQAYSFMGAIGVGASLALVPRFSASSFWRQARDLGVTHFNAVGALVSILGRQAPREDDADHRVRQCYTALAMPEQEHRLFEQRFGLRLTVGYGLSESTFGTVWTPNSPPQYGTIGHVRQHPTLGTINRARVVDEKGVDAEIGQPGELWLKNPATMAGYLNDPAATAVVMQDGWLRTGDVVTCDSGGCFTFAGRLKEMIRRRGENISPGEIEGVLLQHQAVLEAAVVPIPSPLGEDDIRAYVVKRPDVQIYEEELIQWCAEHLSQYKVPRDVIFLDSMPRTATQRVAKNELSGHAAGDAANK